MDATELLKNKQALQAMIKDAVERRDRERLLAISATVHDLELELLESFWDLYQLSRRTKPKPRSQLTQRFLAGIERMTRGYAVGLMSLGVSVAWKAARIRSQIKGGPVPLEFEAFRENSSPLG
jgi:hypothetical protein